MKRAVKLFNLAFLFILVGVCVQYIPSMFTDGNPPEISPSLNPDTEHMVTQWAEMSGNRKGKVVFARPPFLFVLYLDTGLLKKIPNITVAGAKGRQQRGKSPRPFWAPDGKYFVYRFNGTIFVSDEDGNKRSIKNDRMDCSDETRWSWYRDEKNIDWLVGPSVEHHVILVKVSDPKIIRVIYRGGDVEKHCEVTGSNRVVYDNGSDIYVVPAFKNSGSIRISKGQSCRPCASPGNRVGWLPNPHDRYLLYNASDGTFLNPLTAPPQEEMYRLNWANHDDFAVHMFGSRGNTRMHVRRISTGGYLYVGCGWDPDLWVSSH